MLLRCLVISLISVSPAIYCLVICQNETNEEEDKKPIPENISCFKDLSTVVPWFSLNLFTRTLNGSLVPCCPLAMSGYVHPLLKSFRRLEENGCKQNGRASVKYRSTAVRQEIKQLTRHSSVRFRALQTVKFLYG